MAVGSKVYFDEWKVRCEATTGFKCYEDSTNNQLMFWGLDKNFEAFKNYITSSDIKLPTGTIVFCMDKGDTYYYYAGETGRDVTELNTAEINAVDEGESYSATYTTPNSGSVYENMLIEYVATGEISITVGEEVVTTDTTNDGTTKTFSVTYAADTDYILTVTGPSDQFEAKWSGEDVNRGKFYAG